MTPDQLHSVSSSELREAIFVPILTYTDAIDSKKFERLAGAFHQDARLEFGPKTARSLFEIIEWMTEAHIQLTGSQHRLTNFFVDEVTNNTASTRTYVDALLVGGPADEALTYRDVGIYYDQVTYGDGRWLITSRQHESLWREGSVMALRAVADPKGTME